MSSTVPVCCAFLQNKCSNTSCPFLHDAQSARTCSSGERCKHLRRGWEPDSASNSCRCCGKQFGFFTRRHHCRGGCGRLVCAACSTTQMPSIGRVCPRCKLAASQPAARSVAATLPVVAPSGAKGLGQSLPQVEQAPMWEEDPAEQQPHVAVALPSPSTPQMSVPATTPRLGPAPTSADAVAFSKRLSAKLRGLSGATPSSCQVPSLPPVALPADPTAPLFSDPVKHRGASVSIVEWLFALPALEAAAVPDDNTRKDFGAAHDVKELVAVLDGRLRDWFRAVADELENPGSQHYLGLVSPRLGKSADRVAAAKLVQQRLHAAVAALYTQNVDPAVAADELASVFIYTCQMRVIRHNKKSIDTSIYAVANLLLRTCRAAGDKPDSDAQKLLAVYAPFIVRTDTFLARMPKQRRTLFRGVGFDFALQHYAAGSTVSWGQFNSTTTDVEVAQSFAKGKTLLVLHAGSTAAVDFASVQPEESEVLLPTSTVFTSLGVTSPGLMRLLGQHGNLVQLRELGDDPTPQQVVEGMEEAKHALATLSDTFTESYVEARISAVPPPLPDNAPCLMLFQQLLPRFLECSGEFVDQHKHLALLGSGGTGKTSTLLALHTHISRNDHLKQLQQQRQSKRVISIFVALPKLPGDIQDGKCIDAQVLAELGARDLQAAAAIAAEATIVVLLDSLDECVIHGDPKSWRPLLDTAPFCRDHCRVIVSSRPEFADRLPNNTSRFVFGATARQLHVLPLTAAAHDIFISKFVAGRNKELEALVKIHTNRQFMKFQVSDEQPVCRALEKLKLSNEDKRLPVVLTMALEVALHDVRHPNSPSSAAAAAASSSSSDAYCPPPGTRSHVMHRFLESRRTVILPNAAEHTVDAAVFNSLSTALMDVALYMLDRGDWNVTFGNVRPRLLDIFPPVFTYGKESDSERALRVFGMHVPCRVESVHDNSSLFGFWHKSLGEYLCARSLFLDPSATITHRLKTAFSLREPNVCWFFNDLCLGDLPRRRKITRGPLYDIVRASSATHRTATRSLNNSSPAASSNAFALICCSDVSLWKIDFSGIQISECHLAEANFYGANLSDASIRRSNLRSACFDRATVPRLVMKDCSYNQTLCPLYGHDSYVLSVAVSGRYIASGSMDGTIRIWEASSGKEVSVLRAHSGWVTSVAWGPEEVGTLASGGDDGDIRVWKPVSVDASRADTVTFESALLLRGHRNSCLCVVFSPNGEVLASSGGDCVIRLRNVVTRRKVCTLRGHDGDVHAIAFFPGDGGRIVSGSGGDCGIRIWDAETGALIRLLSGHKRDVRSIAFSARGQICSASDDKSVKLWDPTTGALVTTLHQDFSSNAVTSRVAFSADGSRIAGCCDALAQIWDAGSCQKLKSFDGHRGAVRCVAFSPDGRFLVSGGIDGTVRVWNTSDDTSVRGGYRKRRGDESFICADFGKVADYEYVKLCDPVALEAINCSRRVHHISYEPTSGAERAAYFKKLADESK